MTDTTTLQADARPILYLEDLVVEQTFVTGSHTLTEDEIVKFAREFDPQPFHLDEAAARQSLFRGLAASGWHTAAVTMRLMVDGGPRFADGILGIGGELSWIQPTRPGDTLQVHSRILEIRPSRSRPDRGIVKIQNETRNQHGDVVQTFIAMLFVHTRG